MKICISGASGFVGSGLSGYLISKAIKVVEINRSDFSDSAGLINKINGCKALVHLSGSPVYKRWTFKNRNEILESRIETSKALCMAMHQCDCPPEVFMSASAVGIYSSRGEHTEYVYRYDCGFLADVCKSWEEAASDLPAGVRHIVLRLGVILGKKGGMMRKVLPLFNIGLGGRIGNGNQAFPWIHIDDLSRIVLFLLDSDISGPINVVAPSFDDNRSFTAKLSSVLRKPALFPVPGFVLRILYGKASKVFLEGQKVIPQKLLESDFEFQFPVLENALEEIVKNES